MSSFWLRQAPRWTAVIYVAVAAFGCGATGYGLMLAQRIGFPIEMLAACSIAVAVACFSAWRAHVIWTTTP